MIGSFVSAKKRQALRISQTEELIKEGVKQVGKLSYRDFFVIGCALYAAEGTKDEGTISFSNSDPRMIKFMTRWFLEICRIPNDKLRGKLYIHDNLDINKAMEYWSSISQIPIHQFHKPYVVKTNSTFRKNLHKYGVFTIKAYDRKTARRIKGWIKGILENSTIKEDFSPVAQ